MKTSQTPPPVRCPATLPEQLSSNKPTLAAPPRVRTPRLSGLLLLIVAMIVSLPGIGWAVPLAWTSTTTAWNLGGNWFPPGPPGLLDDAQFFGGGTLMVDLSNGGAGNSVATVQFNAATPNHFVEDLYNDFNAVPEVLAVTTSITKDNVNTVQLANLSITCPLLTVNLGGFEFIGTNVVTLGTANINGGTVCVMAWPPSAFNAGAWNVNGGLFKVSGLGVTSPGTASSLIGPVNMSGGTFQAGCSVGTANIIGDLTYGPAASSDFELGTPNIIGSGVNDLINVDGNLTLNGTFNIVSVTGFGAGTYRLINYSGTFVNNGVALGTVPSGFLGVLDFSTTNQVNLVVTYSTNCCPPCTTPTACYTNTIYPEYNYLADNLCHGTNNNLLTTLSGVPDGSAVLIWNAALQDWDYVFYDTLSGGWVDAGFNPISFVSSAPGQGFVLWSPVATYSLIICGCQPICPPPCLTNTTGFILVGKRGVGTAYWNDLSSCPPTCGTIVSIWNPLTQSFSTNTFGANGWSPSTPVVGIGQSVFVKIGTDTNCCPTTNLVVRTGTSSNGGLLTAGSPEQTFQTLGSPVGTNSMVTIDMNSIPGVWSQPNGISQWVGPNANSYGPDGWYTNRWTFYLPCSNATLTGKISTDDEGYLFINGVDFSPNGGFGFGFASVSHNTGFVAGWNTVDIIVHNGGGYTGFRAELTNSFSSCCCTNPVTVICSTNKFVNCGTTWSFDAPIVTEVGGGTNYTVSYTTTTNGSCPTYITRQWQIIDACGNTNTCSQTVTVNYPAPIINCTTNKSVICNSAWNFDAPVLPNNDCDNTLTVLSTVTNGICPKVITRLWLASSLCGWSNFCSQSVTLIDNVPPVIHCSNNKTVPCGSVWNFDVPTATDNCSGTNITFNVVSTVTNGTCTKTITRTWRAVDLCGNQSSLCSQTVTVVDAAAPVFNCSTNKTIQCGTAWQFDTPTVTDACSGGTITPNVMTTFTNGVDCSKTMTRIWQAADNCGNSSTCTQIVSVVDTIAPSLCCPNDITVTTCSNSAIVKWTVKVTDNCTPGLVATCNPPMTDPFPVGTTTVTCTATDACGNVGTCSFKVTVKAGTLKWNTVSLGKLDCFKNGSDYLVKGVDKTPRSVALKSLGAMQGFDGNAITATRFGASFLGLSNNIQCAKLEIWMRPNSSGSNYPAFDTLALGLTNYPASPKFAWTNFIGNSDEPGSILSYDWISAPACGTKITLDLGNLPNGGYNLLPVINQTHRLDMLIQSLTEVDYARLCYCYCASKTIWKGYEWDVANALPYRSCYDFVDFKRTGTGPFTVGTVVGQTRGVVYQFDPFTLPTTADKLTFTGLRVSGGTPNQIAVAGTPGGGLQFNIANVRSNVTQVQVRLYNGSTMLSSLTLPFAPGTNFVTTAPGAMLARAGVKSGGDAQQFKLVSPVQITNANNSVVMADQIDINVLATPSEEDGDMIEGLFIEVEGLDQITLSDVAVQTGEQETRLTGEGVISVSGETTTITADELATNSPVGFTIPVSSIMPPIVIAPVFSGCRSGIMNGDVTANLGGIGDARFTLVTNKWKIDCSLPPLNTTGVRYQVLNAGSVVADTGNNPVTDADVTGLPTHWRFSNVASNGVFRLNWTDAALFTINGNSVIGDELRVIPVGGSPIPNLTTFSVSATEIEALVFWLETTPQSWTMLPLQVTPTQLVVQWTGPSGGVLESAPSVMGPWTTITNQGDFSATLPSPRLPSAPAAQFFRVRSN